MKIEFLGFFPAFVLLFFMIGWDDDVETFTDILGNFLVRIITVIMVVSFGFLIIGGLFWGISGWMK